jgi:hypothetical protein
MNFDGYCIDTVTGEPNLCDAVVVSGLTLLQCQDLCFPLSGCGAIVHNKYARNIFLHYSLPLSPRFLPPLPPPLPLYPDYWEMKKKNVTAQGGFPDSFFSHFQTRRCSGQVRGVLYQNGSGRSNY